MSWKYYELVSDNFFLLRHSLTVYPCLTWNSLYILGWLQTHRGLPASLPQVLGLEVCTNTTGPD